jgi:HAD superfamily hydrolase (TIGR01490 family)
MSQNLALFDLDNTLLAGDSDYNWGQFLISEGLLDGDAHTATNLQFYEDYKNGTLDIYKFLAFQLKPLSEHPRAFLDDLHKKYMHEIIRPMMTKKAQALVDHHKAQGDVCMVITATNSFVTRPIANAYGIEHLIGTEPEEKNGQFTGGVFGTPSFQMGKVTRLKAWLAERNQQLSDFKVSYFYSDSHNDLPLMKLVTNPVAVDADETLTEYANTNGWPLMTLRD